MMRRFLCCCLPLLLCLVCQAVDFFTTESDLIYVSLPAVAPWLGATVDRQGGTVIVRGKTTTMTMTVDGTLLVVNGKQLTATSAPQEKDGVLFLPMSTLTKAFGVQMEWEIEGITLTCAACPHPLTLFDDLRGSRLQYDFYTTISRGRLGQVKKYLQRYPTLLTLPRGSREVWTPLQQAITTGQLDIAQYFIEQGAKLPTGNPTRDLQLVLDAVSSHNTDALTFLAEHGVNVNATDESGVTALMAACANDDLATVRWLVEHGAKVNAMTPPGQQKPGEDDDLWENTDALDPQAYFSDLPDSYLLASPLTNALRNEEMVAYLLAHGADATATLATERFTALHALLLLKDAPYAKVATLLVQHGAKIDAATASGFTPLHLACLTGNAEMVAWLLDHGAKPEMATATVPESLLAIPLAKAKALRGFGTPLMFVLLHTDPKLQEAWTTHGGPTLPEADQQALRNAFRSGQASLHTDTCINNLKQIDLAAQIYTQENDETLPTAKNVWEELKEYGVEPHQLVCPEKPELANGYGYNVALSGVSLGEIDDPTSVLMFADSLSKDNLIRSVADIDFARHGAGYIAAYMDGHVEFVKPVDLSIKKERRED